MHSSSENTISHSTLSDTFTSEETTGKGVAEAEKQLAGLKKSIRQLKAIMLSLEWDLSMQTLEQLDAEIAAQESRWHKDKNVMGLLRILRALGKYIEQKQAHTHPLAIKLFFAVYNGLEKIVLTPDMSPGKRKKMLLLALQRYNEVKEKLTFRERLIARRLQGTAGTDASGKGAEGLQGLTGQAEVVASVSVDPVTAPSEEAAATEGEDGDGLGAEQDVAPALGGTDLSADDAQKRGIWMESGESEDLSNRLASFFEESAQESAPASGMEASDSSIAAEPVAEEGKEAVLDELFSPTEETNSAEQPTVSTLPGFSSDDQIPTAVPLSGEEQEDQALHGESPVESQVSEKLDAFFDESEPEPAVLEGERDDEAPLPDGNSGSDSGEEFSGDLQKRLNSFFDEEDQGEAETDAGVVPYQAAAVKTGQKTGNLLSELLQEIKQLSDDYKHFPEFEEQGPLASLFERTEKTWQANPEILIPLNLLQASLFSFEGGKNQTGQKALACAADLANLLSRQSDNGGAEGSDFAAIVPSLKKFLTLIATDRAGSRKSSPAGNPDAEGVHLQDPDNLDRIDKKSRSEQQSKSKGDLIIEDLFSDE